MCQSPHRDCGASIQGRRNGSQINLRSGIKLATWNVMTLVRIVYLVALVRELARFNVCLTGMSEARIPRNGCQQVNDALTLHSGGRERMDGVALVVRSRQSCPDGMALHIGQIASSSIRSLARTSHYCVCSHRTS